MTNFKALSQTVPPHDYRPALQGALSWLGKRYLLAEPLNRRPGDKVPRSEPQSSPPTLLKSVSMG
ncbi:MAG: hypothetical protein H7Y89_03340 [Steroidobacteraceae bacterium]|nr:hypothetical protein [Steroidobacteraceae bacterium]